MQWAAVYHDHEFAAKDILFELKLLRKKLLGTQDNKSFATTEITTPSSLSPLDYGSLLTQCQPVLRAWHLELRGIKDDWKKCQSKLRGRNIETMVYISLFSTFALRGVSTLAEVVYKYTTDID